MESLREQPRVLLKIAIAWALSLVFPIPQLFIFVQYNHGLKQDGTFRHICGSKGYTSPWQRKVYFTFTTTYILIIPMAIMVYCYMKIIHVVWVRANMTALQFKSSQHQNRQNSHRSSESSDHQLPSTAANKARSVASSPMVKACASHSLSTGPSSTRVMNDVCENDRKRELLTLPRFIARSGQVNVSWLSNKRKNAKASNAKYLSRPRGECVVSAGVSERTGPRKRYGSSRVSMRRNLMATKRRALIMTLSVVVSYLVCLTPYFFFSLLRIYSNYKLKMETAKVISEFMVMIHSTLNPLLYGLFSLRKKHLKHLLTLLFCSKRDRNKKQRKETNKLRGLGRLRLGKSFWRDSDKENICTGGSSGKGVRESSKSSSTCPSSLLSVPPNPTQSQGDCSQTIFKNDLLHIISFDYDSIQCTKSDDCIVESVARGQLENALCTSDQNIANNYATSTTFHLHNSSGQGADISPVKMCSRTVTALNDFEDTEKLQSLNCFENHFSEVDNMDTNVMADNLPNLS